jgi:transposase InsO family protein
VAIEQKQRVVLREYRLDEARLAKFHVIDVLGFCDTVGVNRQIMRRSSKVRPLLGSSLKEAQVAIEKWRVVYNTLRPHAALGYRPPAARPMRL